MMFNGAQFHLLVNHLPVIGFMGTLPALVVAMIWKSRDVKNFVLIATAVIGLSSLAAYWTGEPAEGVVEHFSGVTEELIHAHEEAAEVAMILAVITAVVAAGSYVLQRRKPDSLRVSVPVVFAFSVVVAAAMANTAHEGGKIRHQEIRDKNGPGGEVEAPRVK